MKISIQNSQKDEFQKLKNFCSNKWPVLSVKIQLQQFSNHEVKNAISCKIQLTDTFLKLPSFYFHSMSLNSTSEAIHLCVELCKRRVKEIHARVRQLNKNLPNVQEYRDYQTSQKPIIIVKEENFVYHSIETVRTCLCNDIAVSIFFSRCDDGSCKLICAGVRFFLTNSTTMQFFAVFSFENFKHLIQKYCDENMRAFVFRSQTAKRFLVKAGFRGKIHDIFYLQPYQRGKPRLNNVLQHYCQMFLESEKAETKFRKKVLKTNESKFIEDIQWREMVSYRLHRYTLSISLLVSHFEPFFFS